MCVNMAEEGRGRGILLGKGRHCYLHRKMQSHDAALSERDLRAMQCTCQRGGKEASSWVGGGRAVAVEGAEAIGGRKRATVAELQGDCHVFYPSMCMSHKTISDICSTYQLPLEQLAYNNFQSFRR